MITYWILTIFISIIGAITSPLTLLPDVVLPLQLNQGIQSASSFLAFLLFTVPNFITALFVVVPTYLSVEIGLFSYTAIKWIYNKIPGIT